MKIHWHEEAPRIRSVIVRGVVRQLAFPYVISAVTTTDQDAFECLYVFSRPEPMMSIDDTLYRFPLVRETNDGGVEGSHVRINGSVCMGNSMKGESDPRAAFWNSNFKECLSYTGVAMWEVITAACPERINNVRMMPLSFTAASGFTNRTIQTSPWTTNERKAMREAEGRRIAREAWGCAG